MQVTTPWQAVGKPLWWRRNLALGIGLLAAVLAGSALVSWVAANWVRMGPQARLALVQGGLALTVVLGAALAWLGSRWAGVLTGVAALATGALLALVGQIYQTGADRWQLFLLWAALITPWLLLVRSVFLTLLWAALLNLAAWLWVGGEGLWSWLDGGPAAGVWLVGLNAGLLLAVECGRRFLRDPWHLARRVLAAAMLAWAFNVVALGSVGQGDYPRLTQDMLLGLLPVAVLYAVYGHWRRDLAVVALALLVGIGQVGALWVRMLDSLDGVLGLAVLLLALVWLAAHHLLHLRRAGMAAGPLPADAADALATGSGPSLGEVLDGPETAAPDQDASPPWYLTVLRVGVLIPVLLLLGFWVAASFELDSAADALAAGVMLMCPGLLMARLARRGVWPEVGGVLGVLGLLLCASGVLFLMGDDGDRLTRLSILAAAGGAVYVFSPQFSIRLVAAGLVLGIGFWLSAPEATYFDWQAGARGAGAGASQLAWRLWVFLAAGTALWVWSVQAAHRSGWRPLAWASLAMAAGVALLLAWSMRLPAREWPWFGQLAMFLCALLPGLLLAAWMAAVRPALPAVLRAGVPLAACVAGVGWVDIPALSVALVWLALGRLTGGRVLQALAVPLGLLGLLAYYLNAGNGASLLDKAMILGLTAAWLTGVTAVLAAPLRRGGSGPARRPRWLPAGILAGGALVLGLAQAQVHQYETLLAQGRSVVLALAPVDPRSLLQGDYMALDYVVRRAADDLLRANPETEGQVRRAGRGWLLLRQDGQGVWQLQGIVIDQPPAATPDTVALAFHWRDGSLDFGADNWFFPEGQGERFANARYGVLRVAPDGDGLLAGLLDAQRQPL
ncbi:GDYXXLXY domain-containing protein [uncultured Castellaniella sp.]|uniref:GDYXXLXY domain-containing protein n=1 Tax=uncultured Castellaniella sp. TaxID=647907 RepID=UPI00261659C1|nr:GDYXXLXY domain-containing protein [uncultured Castellaniella sp.]